MFCSNCGQEIQSGVKFCSNCGNAILINDRIQKEKNSTNFNREVVIQYLSDLRNLEVIILKLSSRRTETTEQIKLLGIPQFFKRNYPDYPRLLLPTGFILLIVQVFMFIHAISNEDTAILLLGVVCLIASIYCLLVHSARKSEYEENEYEYQKRIKEDKDRVKKELDKKKSLQTQIQNIEKELNEAKNLLENSYSVNLIPLQYRNIQAVFYLYNYLSTSQETLQNALLHCNLEEIKTKMDIMIKQQSDMILEMAIQNSQLSEIREQNKNLLNYAAQMEQNTTLAAQYARIAANNSRITAWIGLANYIKDK